MCTRVEFRNEVLEQIKKDKVICFYDNSRNEVQVKNQNQQVSRLLEVTGTGLELSSIV